MNRKNTRHTLVASAVLAALVVPTAVGFSAQAETPSDGYFKVKAINEETNSITGIAGAEAPAKGPTAEEIAAEEASKAAAEAKAKEEAAKAAAEAKAKEEAEAKAAEEAAKAAELAKEPAAWKSSAVPVGTGASAEYITFSAGKFSTANSGYGYSSSDGVTWTQSPGTINNGTTRDVASGPKGFISTGFGASSIAWGTNGTSYSASQKVDLKASLVAGTPTGFVAVANAMDYNYSANLAFGTTVYSAKTDSTTISWSQNYTKLGGTVNALASSLNSQIVVFAVDGRDFADGTVGVTGLGVRGADGEVRLGVLGGSWSAVEWNSGTFTAISSDGKKVASSTDGVNWTVKDSNLGAGYKKVSQGGGYYVATNDTNGVATSKDGVTWREYKLPGADAGLKLKDVAFGNGTFTVLGSKEVTYTTPKLSQSWTFKPADLG